MVFTKKDGIFMGYVSFREGNPTYNNDRYDHFHGHPSEFEHFAPEKEDLDVPLEVRIKG